MIVLEIVSIILIGMLFALLTRKTIENIQNLLFERKHKKQIEECRKNQEKLLKKREEINKEKI